MTCNGSAVFRIEEKKINHPEDHSPTADRRSGHFDRNRNFSMTNDVLYERHRWLRASSLIGKETITL
jgi:hypothetical protein